MALNTEWNVKAGDIVEIPATLAPREHKTRRVLLTSAPAYDQRANLWRFEGRAWLGGFGWSVKRQPHKYTCEAGKMRHVYGHGTATETVI